MSVSEILGGKGSNIISTDGNATISDVAGLLAQHRIGAVVVMDGEKVAGIASERDIVREIANNDEAALSKPISSCMTHKVVSCSLDDNIDTLMEKMTTGKFRHIPVIDNDNLVGIISIGDVVKLKIEMAEQEAEEMKRYIAG